MEVKVIMSIIDKQLFATELRERLNSKLTVNDIESVVAELTYQMSCYNIERKSIDTDQQDFADMVNLFTDTKRIEGRSEKTLIRYKYILRKFREHDHTPIRDVTVFNIRQFLSY